MDGMTLSFYKQRSWIYAPLLVEKYMIFILCMKLYI